MQCRYCLETANEFIFPCRCKTPVHQECLMKWLKVSRRSTCEICNEPWPEIIWQIEKLEIWFKAMVATLCMVVVSILAAFGFLKIITKGIIMFMTIACVLHVVNIVIFVPLVIILPIFTPISLITSIYYFGERAVMLAEEYL